MKQRTRSLPLLVLVAVVALVLGSVGTASATGLTKHTVKKIAAKVIHKQAGGFSVAHPTTADSATTATNATNAGNAATLGGLAANQLARASTASSPFFGAISSSSFV